MRQGGEPPHAPLCSRCMTWHPTMAACPAIAHAEKQRRSPQDLQRTIDAADDERIREYIAFTKRGKPDDGPTAKP